jgi:hypothetical protein
MKSIKVLLSLFLAFAILLLSGCSDTTLPLQTESEQEGLVEITDMTSKMSGFIDVAMNDDNIVFLTIHDMTTYQLTLFNPQKNKIICEKDLTDVDFDVVSEIEFVDNDKISVIDGGAEKSYVYDLDFNLVETNDYEYHDYSEDEKLSEFFDGTFGYMDDYALCYDTDYDICVFYDQPDVAYFSENDGASIMDNYGMNMFMVNYLDESNSAELSIVDYSTCEYINKVQVESKGTGIYVSVIDYDMNDKYVCVVVDYSMENGVNSTCVYYWNYTLNPISEKANVFSLKKKELQTKNSELISDVKDKYNINVMVDKEPEVVEEDYEEDYDFITDSREIDYDVNDLQVYLLLNKMTQCLDMFPDNFFAEMYESADDDCDFEVHIVKSISDAGAFASRYGQFSITLATSSYSNTTMCHELMHLIEARILDYYNSNDEDFYTLWEQYNPTDFWYGSLGDNTSNYNENYFISAYSTTDIREDFADTLQYLFDSYYCDEQPDWMNYTIVNDKATFLCKSIREAFPSVKNTDQAFWEKYITYDA